MFFFVLLINMMRSRVPNHIQAVPESASERDMRIRTVANPAGSVVPEPCASTLPVGRGGRAGRQTEKQQARGQPAPGAMCFQPSAHPLPRWHLLGSSGLTVRSPPWMEPHSPGSGSPYPPGLGPLAHHLRWPPTEPGRPRHCRPHWTGLPQVQGQASWLPAPAPRGCAGPGCDGAELHTAGPCPWNLPGRGRGKQWVIRSLGWGVCCPL